MNLKLYRPPGAKCHEHQPYDRESYPTARMTYTLGCTKRGIRLSLPELLGNLTGVVRGKA